MEYVVMVSPQEVRGEMKIYSCPKSICTHVDWALSDIFQNKIELDWQPQQIAPGAYSANLNWHGPIGLSSRVVSILSKWPKLRLEVFQDSNRGNDLHSCCDCEEYNLNCNYSNVCKLHR